MWCMWRHSTRSGSVATLALSATNVHLAIISIENHQFLALWDAKAPSSRSDNWWSPLCLMERAHHVQTSSLKFSFSAVEIMALESSTNIRGCAMVRTASTALFGQNWFGNTLLVMCSSNITTADMPTSKGCNGNDLEHMWKIPRSMLIAFASEGTYTSTR